MNRYKAIWNDEAGNEHEQYVIADSLDAAIEFCRAYLTTDKSLIVQESP